MNFEEAVELAEKLIAVGKVGEYVIRKTEYGHVGVIAPGGVDSYGSVRAFAKAIQAGEYDRIIVPLFKNDEGYFFTQKLLIILYCLCPSG